MRKIYYTIIALFFALSSFAVNEISPSIFVKVDQSAMNQWVDSVFNSMSMDERIGQLIMVICDGENSSINKRNICSWENNEHIGGILFSASDPMSQASLTNAAQANTKVPLLVGVDGEWGLAMRLKNTTHFPMNMMLGAMSNDSLLYYYGKEVARQCRRMGIQVNFAPDMDVNSNPKNPVIGRRSFGEDPENVARKGIMYSRGLEDGGVLSVAKHFPGHGNTSKDSHYTLPVINLSKQQMKTCDFIPFQKYIQAGLGGVMIAHLNIPALDTIGEPSSLSKDIITSLLRDTLGFKGLVFTDGLQMKGVSNEKDISIRALLAGDDVLLGPISPSKEFKAIQMALKNNQISEELINEKCRKILAYKYALGLNMSQPIETQNLLNDLNSTDADWLNRKLNERSITLLKNQNHLLPLTNLDKKVVAMVSLGGKAYSTFSSMLNRYTDVKTIDISDSSQLYKLDSLSTSCNTVIISINTRRNFRESAILNYCSGKNIILNFFTSPYEMADYPNLIKKASAVICSYENQDLAQEYAAQAIFGGIGVDAKLPVSVQGAFCEGTGVKTTKTRLSYSIPEEVCIDSKRLERVDSIVKEGLDERAYPGCQVLIAKDGVVIYDKAFGYQDYKTGHKVENADLYDLASMTKASATLLAVMKLYDERKIGVTDYISKYVPELRGTNKSRLMLRDALFHETGLKPFLAFYQDAIDESSYSGSLFAWSRDDQHPVEYGGAWTNPNFRFLPGLVSSTEKKNYDLPVAKGLYANEKFRNIVLQDIANSKLGRKGHYRYSDLNFILLREVVEAVSKENMSKFLQDNFYKKLGATTTTFLPLEKFDESHIVPTENDHFLRKQLLRGYVDDEAAAFLGGVSGNAGLFSCANDLAKLYQMWLNNGVYGGQRFLEERTCNLFTKSKSANSRRGLGFDKPNPISLSASPCGYSAPNTTYGHTGFTGTCFWIDPDNNLIYIFLSNRINESRSSKKLMSLNIRTRIQDAIYDSFKKIEE